MEILQENETHRLELDTIRGENWLTLVEKATGMAQLLTHATKGHPHNHAAALRKSYSANNITLDRVAASFDRMGLEKVKMYKAQEEK